MGSIALQYSAAAGATIIATARRGPEVDFVGDLSAAHTVNYTGDVVAQVRAIAPEGVDTVLHLAGDGAALAGLLAEGGRLASTLGFGPDQHPAAISIMANPSPATLERLAADATAQRIRVPVTKTYPLTDAAQALADYGAGAIGKLAVTIGEISRSEGGSGEARGLRWHWCNGRLLIQQALAQGHTVTVDARTPAKLAPSADLTVVEGQLDNADGVRRAVEGADAVISLLGVATSTPSAPDPADGRDLAWRR